MVGGGHWGCDLVDASKSGDADWQAWDVTRMGSEYIVFYSAKITGAEGGNSIGLAYTAEPEEWETDNVHNRTCYDLEEDTGATRPDTGARPEDTGSTAHTADTADTGESQSGTGDGSHESTASCGCCQADGSSRAGIMPLLPAIFLTWRRRGPMRPCGRDQRRSAATTVSPKRSWFTSSNGRTSVPGEAGSGVTMTTLVIVDVSGDNSTSGWSVGGRRAENHHFLEPSPHFRPVVVSVVGEVA